MWSLWLEGEESLAVSSWGIMPTSAVIDLSQYRTQVGEPFKIRLSFWLGWEVGPSIGCGRWTDGLVPCRIGRHCSDLREGGTRSWIDPPSHFQSGLWGLLSCCLGFWTTADFWLCHCLLYLMQVIGSYTYWELMSWPLFGFWWTDDFLH